MDNEKKFSAKEAALAVLKKAEEMLKSSKVAKLAKSEEQAQPSKEEPKGEIHPKEHVEGESEHPKERIEDQKSPEHNEDEQKEGNNPEWGAEPGHYKLAKFCGHMGAKRKMKA